MGLKNTGLSNNPPNRDEVTPNRDVEQPGAGEDSDSDLDDFGEYIDYMPLSQNPNDGEPLYSLSNESGDEEMDLQETATANASGDSPGLSSDLSSSQTSLVHEVWLKPLPKEVDIEMTDDKIDLVKQVMLGIQLPPEAIPVWAKNVPEEDWKDHLSRFLPKTDD